MGVSELAIAGGTPVISQPLRRYRSMGAPEAEAVRRVIESDCLSGFYGSWGEEFLGGPRVREFEAAWSQRFDVPYTVSVNSATSGLFAAVGAVGVEPGDEVIVPPFTMSATAMAPLVYGGIPVFADIEPDTFCLDPAAVRAAITPRTRAILTVNLFGHPSQLAALRRIADEHGIALIEDAAQSPLAHEQGRLAGTVGHIGVFSLNYHKHIHTGEGGMCVTADERLARRLQLIRNHAEAVVEEAGVSDLVNMVGFNYRLTELSAAVGLVQLADAEAHVSRRERLAVALSNAFAGLEGITVPIARAGCRHVYYVWAMRFDADAAGCSRAEFSRALQAEGFPHFVGYRPPLYMLPLFQKQIAFGSKGFPFNLGNPRYEKGMCPVTERIHEREFMGFEPCIYDVTPADVERLIEAFRKVHRHRHALPGMKTEVAHGLS